MTDDRRSSALPGAAAASWPSILDGIEGELLDAQRSIASGDQDRIAAWGRRMDDWIPPTGTGPMPDDLRERAAALLQHQLAVAEEIVERITQSKRQREIAARMSYRSTRPAASFFDSAI